MKVVKVTKKKSTRQTQFLIVIPTEFVKACGIGEGSEAIVDLDEFSEKLTISFLNMEDEK